jgi:hypothetical protein
MIWKVVYQYIYHDTNQGIRYAMVWKVVCTTRNMIYSVQYITCIQHGIYHVAILLVPWYIPKVVYTFLGVVPTMGQPSR